MANDNRFPCNTGFNYEHSGHSRPTSDIARKNDVKYLKCVDDNCPGRATLKNGNIRITTEHAQHDVVTEVIGVARGCSGCTCTPRGDNFFSGLIYRKMCKCTPLGHEVHPPSQSKSQFLGQLMLGGLDWRYLGRHFEGDD